MSAKMILDLLRTDKLLKTVVTLSAFGVWKSVVVEVLRKHNVHVSLKPQSFVTRQSESPRAFHEVNLICAINED